MFASSGRAQLAYDATPGTAECDVLLIHAGVADRRSWHAVIARLQPRHRCVSFDARGYGETTYESEPGWSAVDDVLAVLDSAGAERVCVVASSLGGQTAIDLALDHPDRVRGLALIAPGVRGAPPTPPDPPTERLGGKLDAAEATNDLAEVNRLEAWMWLDGPTAAEHRVQGAPRELFLDMNGRALRADDPGPAADSPSAWNRLDQIAVPTSIVIGSLDTARMQALAVGAADRIDGARLRRVDGSPTCPISNRTARPSTRSPIWSTLSAELAWISWSAGSFNVVQHFLIAVGSSCDVHSNSARCSGNTIPAELLGALIIALPIALWLLAKIWSRTSRGATPSSRGAEAVTRAAGAVSRFGTRRR